MSYKAPVGESEFLLRHCSSLQRLIAAGACGDLSLELAGAVLEQAGRFAGEVLEPLNTVMDRVGVHLAGGKVATAPGHAAAYRAWAEAGWNAVSAPPEWGGMGLPLSINTVCLEYWHSACMAFGLGPLLSMGAADAIDTHATPELKRTYLPKLVSGEWMATMNLTEPQAGSDLGALRTRALPQDDGSYRLFGSKIFITCGDHDLTDNIVHLVLARLPDAPAGSRGISLFLVPKTLPADDGTPGAANDVRCTGIEHKLGLHGSPTCSMAFGDREGAVGWLVGAPNGGLRAMFTMMNRARLAVAAQGVAIAEIATQRAARYAAERRQGRAPDAGGDEASPIDRHPDVARMLLSMRSYTEAARGIVLRTADAIDRARLEPDPEQRRAAQEDADLLTPIAKAFATDIGVEVASLGIQVHGGMGYVEETGAAQYLRDVRICTIYEGTNGIQAIDLVARKLAGGGRAAAARQIAGYERIAEQVRCSGDESFGATADLLTAAGAALAATTDFLDARRADGGCELLAGATSYLRLFGLAAGMACLAQAALAAGHTDDADDYRRRVALARYFAEHHGTACGGLAEVVLHGGASLAQAMAFSWER
ncbi:MAG: acyl-CoA dehydrogenase [Burkholderiaceae bacterium]